MTCIIQNEIEQHMKDIEGMDRMTEDQKADYYGELAEKATELLGGESVKVNGATIEPSDVFDEAVETERKGIVVEWLIAAVNGNNQCQLDVSKTLEDAAVKLVAIQAECDADELAEWM